MANSRSYPSDSLLKQVSTFLDNVLRTPAQGSVLPCNDEDCAPQLRRVRLVVALSGGLDSTVLLNLLSDASLRPRFELAAAHVHHGLSQYADDWAAHCQKVCDRLAVPLVVSKVQVGKGQGSGVEAAARQARHASLAELDADWIVLAHHADDQAETVLHRLVRGTGLKGAAAMRPIDVDRRLLRPLLHTRRRALEKYASEHGLSWVEDDSNPDTRFTRNFLRHDILAPLSGRFPEAAANISRAATLFAEAAALLDELAQSDFGLLEVGSPRSREALRALPLARARNVTRHWLSLGGCRMPDEAALDEGLAQLRGEADAVAWRADGASLCAYRSTVWLEPHSPEPPNVVQWRGESVVAWGGGVIRFEFVERPPADMILVALDAGEIRVRAGGERLRLGPNRPSRSLSQWCQERGIPAWWRSRLPMLWQGDRLVWIGGIGADAAFHAPPGTPGWRVSWEPPGTPPFLRGS